MIAVLIPPHWLLTAYCALVLLASLAGGWLLLIIHPTHTRLQLATSFVAGLMLGIALLHFLPDAAEQLHSVDRTARGCSVVFWRCFSCNAFSLSPSRHARRRSRRLRRARPCSRP